MKNLIFCAVLLLMAGVANAAVYNINSGNWDSTASWNTNATGDPSFAIADNGDAPPNPAPITNGSPTGILSWAPAIPATLDGTYGGQITVDDATGAVTGGSLIVTGAIADETLTGDPGMLNSWWFHQYVDLVINFGDGSVTGTYICSQASPINQAPAPCSAISGGRPASQWAPIAGEEGIGGAAREAAVFNSNTGLLEIFHEAWSTPGPGTDVLQTLTLDVTLIPIPAVAWMFPAGLIAGLGWMRRRANA